MPPEDWTLSREAERPQRVARTSAHTILAREARSTPLSPRRDRRWRGAPEAVPLAAWGLSAQAQGRAGDFRSLRAATEEMSHTIGAPVADA